jgi:hypothetical protein
MLNFNFSPKNGEWLGQQTYKNRLFRFVGKAYLFFIAFSLLFLSGLKAQTYSGSPTSISAAICPSGTGTGSSCALTFSGGTIKAYISSISGNNITIRAVKCDGTPFGGGTIYLKSGDVCGSVLSQATIVPKT